jgi:hypothetical protein
MKSHIKQLLQPTQKDQLRPDKNNTAVCIAKNIKPDEMDRSDALMLKRWVMLNKNQ